MEQPKREIDNIIDGLTLFDDDLMSVVFDGNIKAAELLLKVVLKRDDIEVISVAGQREFQNPVAGGRNIRLDIFAKDGFHIVYVNGSYKGDDAISRLIHDFSCKRAGDMYYPELAEGVRHFKEEEGGRETMCEAVEKYAEKYAEKKVERERPDTLFSTINSLMDTMKWTAEQAMSAMKISDSDRAVLLKRL